MTFYHLKFQRFIVYTSYTKPTG